MNFVAHARIIFQSYCVCLQLKTNTFKDNGSNIPIEMLIVSDL